MADASSEDASKAEKLAAARKRFEQLKKQRDKKRDAPSASGAPPPPPAAEVKAGSSTQADAVEAPSGGVAAEGGKPLSVKTAGLPEEAPASQDESAVSPTPSRSAGSPAASHSRAASAHARRTSSSGFRRPSVSTADILRSASKSPLSLIETVPDIYRKQASTISDLTELVEKLEAEVEALKEKERKLGEAILQKDEAQQTLAGVKTELKEAVERAEAAAVGQKAGEEETERLKSEVAALTRQASHLTSQLSLKDKTISDLKLHSSQSSSTQDRESLDAKEDQIENMEMEISKLRSDFERASKSLAESQFGLAAAEARAKDMETAQETLSKELEETKKRLERAAERLVSEGAARSSAETRAASVKLELESVKAASKTQASSVSSWEKDYNTLKIMYKEADTNGQEAQRKSATLERENKTLTSQVTELRKRAVVLESENTDLRARLERSLREGRKGTGSMPQDDEVVDELEDAERRRLQAKVRQLEQQLFDERKQWHASEKLRLTSSAPPPSQHQEFLDVDLNAGDGPDYTANAKGGDELYAAHVEEERRRMEAERLERVKEVKRGLVKWKGWRLDMVAGGGFGVNYRDVFEV